MSKEDTNKKCVVNSQNSVKFVIYLQYVHIYASAILGRCTCQRFDICGTDMSNYREREKVKNQHLCLQNIIQEI